MSGSLAKLAVLLVVLMVPFATVNPVLYAYLHNWRKSPEGRALMTCFMGLAALVDLAVFYQFVPWFPGKSLVACVVYAALLTGFIRFTVVLVKLLRKQRKQ